MHVYEQWLSRAARLHPERIAIDAPDGVLTYAELFYEVNGLAAELEGRAARGDRVAIDLPSGLAFALALHTCWEAGWVAVPIDQRLPAQRREERLASCAWNFDVEQARKQSGSRSPDGVSQAALWFSAHPAYADVNRLIPVGSSAGSDGHAAVLWTSGSTGPGTEVDLSYRALLWNAIGSAAALGQPHNERWLSAMPVSHVGGLTVLARSAIGATTAVLRPSFDLEDQLRSLMAGEATITSMVPTMLARLLDAGLHRPPNLRLVLLGGGPIPPSLIERAGAVGIQVAATYGLSEACSQVFTGGAPLFCTQVALRGELEDPLLASDDPAAADEILVRGPTLATGVAGPGGWLATGDRGRRGTGGRFSVVGRLAETIVTGGENVAPTEVEAQLVAQPGIVDAAVLGLPDAEWGERLEARVVLAPGHVLDERALRVSLRDVLPPYAVPKRITAEDALPRTPTGKLIRRELR